MNAHAADSGHHTSLSGYLSGFVLAVVLTAVPFWVIGEKVLAPGAATALALVFAALQIVVHMHYFLHLSPKAESGWSLLALAFTGLLVGIVLWGSAWVMGHMNANMMPMPMAAARPGPAPSGPAANVVVAPAMPAMPGMDTQGMH